MIEENMWDMKKTKKKKRQKKKQRKKGREKQLHTQTP